MSDTWNDVAFWAQVLEDGRRTLVCCSEEADMMRAVVERLGFGSQIVVASSPAVARGVAYVVDQNALNAALAESQQRGWGQPDMVPSPPESDISPTLTRIADEATRFVLYRLRAKAMGIDQSAATKALVKAYIECQPAGTRETDPYELALRRLKENESG